MNTSSRRRRNQWSSLQKELLTIIGDRLETRIDVLRFRAVCTAWRSSIPLTHRSSPHFPMKLPYPNLSSESEAIYGKNRYYCTLNEITVYRFEPLLQDNDSEECSKGWLVKLEEFEPGKLRLLNPLSQHQIRYTPEMFPKQLNLLDYRVFELSKGYKLEHVVNSYYRIRVDKVIYSADDSAVLMIYGGGKLAFFRLGDETWNQLGETWTEYIYSDILLYNGKFHAINLWGSVAVIDSSTLKITKLTNPLCEIGSRKHFVLSSGDLYVIDLLVHTGRLMEDSWELSDQVEKRESDDENEESDVEKRESDQVEKRESDDENEENRHSIDHCWAYFRIYKLNEAVNDGLEEKRLMNRVAFLGDDCSFLASPEKFAGCKRNCIYYTDKDFYYNNEKDRDVFKGLKGHNTVLFNLEDGSLRGLASDPGNFQVIWPPPSWFKSN